VTGFKVKYSLPEKAGGIFEVTQPLVAATTQKAPNTLAAGLTPRTACVVVIDMKTMLGAVTYPADGTALRCQGIKLFLSKAVKPLQIRLATISSQLVRVRSPPGIGGLLATLRIALSPRLDRRGGPLFVGVVVRRGGGTRTFLTPLLQTIMRADITSELLNGFLHLTRAAGLHPASVS
jgi:hypothetical protein